MPAARKPAGAVTPPGIDCQEWGTDKDVAAAILLPNWAGSAFAPTDKEGDQHQAHQETHGVLKHHPAADPHGEHQDHTSHHSPRSTAVETAAIDGVVESHGASLQNQMTHPSWKRWQGSQRRIGLTGGIATGKSTVGRWLEQQGLPVLDADVFAREALSPGSASSKAVLERYGARVQAQGGEGQEAVIDRGALGGIVFHDPAEKAWLEDLIHPVVRARFDQELSALSQEPTVVLMIPLLFEAGLEELCSEIWLVDCREAQQLERLMQRDGLSEAEAQARINAQWPMEEKRRMSDYLINNTGLTELAIQQAHIALKLQSKTRGIRQEKSREK